MRISPRLLTLWRERLAGIASALASTLSRAASIIQTSWYARIGSTVAIICSLSFATRTNNVSGPAEDATSAGPSHLSSTREEGKQDDR
jgi:hypothetical protein